MKIKEITPVPVPPKEYELTLTWDELLTVWAAQGLSLNTDRKAFITKKGFKEPSTNKDIGYELYDDLNKFVHRIIR